ncbi:MAG: GYF domain-containing protein [Verrucomicrobiota bacterium]
MTSWYYQEADQAVGPFGIDVIQKLKLASIISDETLVRNGATAEWKPLHIAFLPDNSQDQSMAGSKEGLANPQPDKLAGPEIPNGEYFYLDADRQPRGPLSLPELQRLFTIGIISHNALVAYQGAVDWMPLYQLKGLGRVHS